MFCQLLLVKVLLFISEVNILSCGWSETSSTRAKTEGRPAPFFGASGNISVLKASRIILFLQKVNISFQEYIFFSCFFV